MLPADSSVPDHLQAWAPFWPEVESSRNLFLRVIGRMRPEVTIAAARADVAAIARRVSRELGAERAFTTVALQTDDVREIRGQLLALFAGVGILLMIACVNVASLLIARAASRARENALRLALGASRGRLLRQSLLEGFLLTLLGVTAGLLAGHATVCKRLGKRATLHPLDTADHGFRTLKRSRNSEEDIFVEMARVVREWASSLK